MNPTQLRIKALEINVRNVYMMVGVLQNQTQVILKKKREEKENKTAEGYAVAAATSKKAMNKSMTTVSPMGPMKAMKAVKAPPTKAMKAKTATRLLLVDELATTAWTMRHCRTAPRLDTLTFRTRANLSLDNATLPRCLLTLTLGGLSRAVFDKIAVVLGIGFVFEVPCHSTNTEEQL